ncbi:MAG TPA: knotted carbamoyltransferase YgeW [Myxococcales bacterium]|nr:knotted carbamoyltransferase YgeW [Myxococcales bacterium]
MPAKKTTTKKPAKTLKAKAPRFDKKVLKSLYGKSLLLTTDWNTAEIEALLTVADRFAALDRKNKLKALLPNQLAYAMFFDNSTRTKSAWAGASTRLGMMPVIVDGSSTQVAHGETASETGAMLGMNSHAMGVRHDMVLGEGNAFMRDVKRGIDEYLASTKNPRKVPVVNLQCDIDHPTQTLADLMWLRENFGKDGLRGKKVAVSWAYSPSYAKPLSVPQGLIMLLTRYGADITLAHPKGYELMDQCLDAAKKNSEESGGKFTVTNNMDQAFEGAIAVYPKSWGPYDLMLKRVGENDKAALAALEKQMLAMNAKHKDWICNEERMAKTVKGNALYLHCLPADIGAEVSPGVMQKHVVNVAREANWKVYVIMAMLAIGKVPNLGAKLGL